MRDRQRFAKARGERGAALVEYVLILPLVLLLFFGTLEVLRVMSIKQSLRSGLRQALPYFTHWKDLAARPHYYPPHEVILQSLRDNPFSVRVYELVITPDDRELDLMQYGDVFEVRAEAIVPLGFLYPFAGGNALRLVETHLTFIDSSPEFLELNMATPFPREAGH